MPVYKPEEYPEVIARIQKKVAERKLEMGPCLSEEEIVDFEQSCKIQLPQAYRLFLQSVGDGCGCESLSLIHI